MLTRIPPRLSSMTVMKTPNRDSTMTMKRARQRTRGTRSSSHENHEGCGSRESHEVSVSHESHEGARECQGTEERGTESHGRDPFTCLARSCHEGVCSRRKGHRYKPPEDALGRVNSILQILCVQERGATRKNNGCSMKVA